jgi:hypothetical protein
MPVPLQFCASLKNAIMYASSRVWPTCRHTRGGHASVWTKLPLLIPYHSFDMRDPHVRAFFNLSPGEREREIEREGAYGQPATGVLQSRLRAGCAGCGIPQFRAPVASRPRASSNLGRRRAPPVAGSSGQPAAGELQSWPQAGSVGRGQAPIPTAGGLHRPRYPSRGPAPPAAASPSRGRTPPATSVAGQLQPR